MELEWDEAKNHHNIAKHGIDFADAHSIFINPIVVRSDERHEYGEQRWLALGTLGVRPSNHYEGRFLGRWNEC